MKKKILFAIGIISSILSLSSCETTHIVTKIDEEVEVTQIQNTITDVYAQVSKGCCGIVVTDENGSGATGSGVVYAYNESDETYYVVTNAHVVEDSEKQMVFFGEGKYISATLIGTDSKNDVAVLKFNLDIINKDLDIYVNDIFNYEEVDSLIPGQTVLAIGCPLGVENYNILTTGVVSSVSYSQISTDAAINPGNSGGGLFNLQGRLIGLNTEKEVWTSSTDSSGITSDIAVEGRGYAISLAVVKKCINDIVAVSGDVTRPTLGLSVVTVNKVLNSKSEYIQYLPVSDDVVFFVVDSYSSPTSSAQKAGVRPHDVILEVEGQKVNDSQDILDVLNSKTLNDTVTLKIYRIENGTGKTLDIVVSFN